MQAPFASRPYCIVGHVGGDNTEVREMCHQRVKKGPRDAVAAEDGLGIYPVHIEPRIGHFGHEIAKYDI